MGKGSPPLFFVKDGGGLKCLTAWEEECLDKFKDGDVVQIKVSKARSHKHNSLYWVILASIAENSETYNDSQDLHRVLKVALGYTRKIKLLRPSARAGRAREALNWLRELWRWLKTYIGETMFGIERVEKIAEVLKEFETDCEEITLPGSTAFDSMDQKQFNDYYRRAMDELRAAGYDVDAYEAEAKKKLKKSLPHNEVNDNVSEWQEAA